VKILILLAEVVKKKSEIEKVTAAMVISHIPYGLSASNSVYFKAT
jgi:hypothetical protein